MKSILTIATVLTLSCVSMARSTSLGGHCEVAPKTVQYIHGWLHTSLELAPTTIIYGHIVPALKKDKCVASKITEAEMVTLAERLMNDVTRSGFTVKEVIQEFLFE